MCLFVGCVATTDEGGLSRGKGDGARKAEMITLQYAAAEDVYDALKLLLGDPPSPPVAPDPRTNSIIVVGSPGEIRRVKEVISIMDRKSPESVK